MLMGSVFLAFITIVTVAALACPLPASAAVNTAPPASPVKLVFIHHSVGEAWLADGHGGLGIALRDNNYFVSDTNYGWGPGAIGDRTDIGHWWTWFRSASSGTYLSALYDESDRHSNGYSRLAADPGGRNTIVMFKSCYPNSVLGGQPDAPVPSIDDNPMKGAAWSWQDATYTVARAKGIYLDLLPYFAAHPEKLFVVVAAPPRTDPLTPGGRALANWLVDHWLQDSGYTANNVMVFDLYTVLTSKTGNGDSDVGLPTGNHHRVWEGAIQHKTDEGADRLAYPSADGNSHPNAAGSRKATAEFLPLLNAAYNAWKGNDGGDAVGPRTYAPRSASVRRGQKATLYYRVTDNIDASATVVIRIRSRAGLTKKTLVLGLKGTGPLRHTHFTCRLVRGVYNFTVYASDLSGNPARAPLGSNRLTVR
jgi:hypothetical protein